MSLTYRLSSSAICSIFMGGADGFLYELTYGHTDSWWGGTSRACIKQNRSRKRDRAFHFVMSALYRSADPIVDLTFDEGRNILYLLTVICYCSHRVQHDSYPQVRPVSEASSQLRIPL